VNTAPSDANESHDLLDTPSSLDFLPHDGEMARLIRGHDWATTTLGHTSQWSASLRMVVRFMLANRFPHLLWWGPDYIQIYNDYYSPILGSKHPQLALGKPFRECWHEVYHILGPLVDTPFNGGPAPLDPRPIDVNSLVGGMSELLNRTIGETISVETVRSAGLWKVEADPNALESAILNLAVNARDAMPQGGRLTIETMNAHIDEAYAITHAEVTPGQYVAISISDSGVGMDADTLSRAFEPFFTTKPVGKGTGLGLSQVYGFVKQSGGHVKIYSEVGEGTTVKIYLPRLEGSSDEINSQPMSPVPEGTQGETILVVEDDESVRLYSVEALRDLGYRVVEASDGSAALRLLESQSRIDLLFTDVVLPGGMTGAQVAARARELHPDLKILFTTGYARNAIFHHGRLDKGVQLLTKPFSFTDLAAKIRDVLDGLPRQQS
jgi:CheY-like chemotaxis protein